MVKTRGQRAAAEARAQSSNVVYLLARELGDAAAG